MSSIVLADYTTLRLGGPAATATEATTEGELIDAIGDADGAGEELLLLGGGSNLVVADEGIKGPVVLVRTSGITVGEDDDSIVRVAAGEPWDPFVEQCVAEGRPDAACLSGIPGSVGATPIQNVGAYGREVGEMIREIRVLDRKRGAVGTMRAQDAQFGYRRSLIKRTPGRYAVLSVTFRLPHSPGSPALYAELAKKLDVEVGAVVPGPELRQAVLELRRAKGMVLDPRDPDTVSAGSFFTNPILDSSEFFKLQQRVRAQFGDGVAPPAFPSGTDGRTKTSAAWLIDRAGFDKGYGNPDGIAISGKHVLALTNRGQGTTAELVILAREIATAVWDTFGVRLVPEPVFAGHSW